VADVNCCITAIDVGAYGREGDSNIFKKFEFWKTITPAAT
jgi:hypothetical protein